MSERVRITDVSPRDGLQNEPGVISTRDKAHLINLLAHAGLDEIEVTSFVSAKWVPQLGDAAELLAILAPSSLAPQLSALVPNDKGMQSLLDANKVAGRTLITKASVFTAASETFAHKNTNASIAQTLERFKPVIAAAKAQHLQVRGYISCVIACPFEGPIAPAKVADVASALVNLGVDELDLGDTIGAGTPESTRAMLDAVHHAVGPHWRENFRTTLHLHDTFGRAASCVQAALDAGIRSFDGSVAGLGGCPYASTPTKRAPGNIDTALLVRTIHAAGYRTSVNLDALAQAADFARSIVAASRTTASAKP
jgi:hydroxymethylglutaryl-CoA lyase